MPTSTHTALQTVTLSSSASSVVFGNLGSSYKDLLILANITNSSQTELYLRFNSDTGSNYSTIRMQGSTVPGTASASTSAATGMRLNGNGDIMTSVSFTAVLHIMDYSETGKTKSVLSRTSSASGNDACIGVWGSTSAVTSVTVYPNAGSFNSGSTISIYGVEA